MCLQLKIWEWKVLHSTGIGSKGHTPDMFCSVVDDQNIRHLECSARDHFQMLRRDQFLATEIP